LQVLPEFQFLLVRLKEQLLSKGILLIKISIPFGAIKRFCDYLLTSDVVKFQFLLVRLKDFVKFTAAMLINISIPFGAIKSRSIARKNRNLHYFNSFWCD